MTPGQRAAFQKVMAQLSPGRFVHGDCEGADADAHAIVLGTAPIRIRPALSSRRAHCSGADEVLPPRRPLDRNRDIVRDADVMVAVSPSPHEVVRSGTWAAIRYARKTQTPVIILWPDGQVSQEPPGIIPQTPAPASP